MNDSHHDLTNRSETDINQNSVRISYRVHRTIFQLCLLSSFVLLFMGATANIYPDVYPPDENAYLVAERAGFILFTLWFAASGLVFIHLRRHKRSLKKTQSFAEPISNNGEVIKIDEEIINEESQEVIIQRAKLSLQTIGIVLLCLYYSIMPVGMLGVYLDDVYFYISVFITWFILFITAATIKPGLKENILLIPRLWLIHIFLLLPIIIINAYDMRFANIHYMFFKSIYIFIRLFSCFIGMVLFFLLYAFVPGIYKKYKESKNQNIKKESEFEPD